MRAAVLSVVLLSLLAPADASPRTARDVVVRGGRDLADLLGRATRPAWRDAARTVAIVVDVTPHTIARKAEIAAALETVGDSIRHLDSRWSIAPLGGRLTEPVRHPSALVPRVGAVLATETEEVNTLRALRATLERFGDRGGVVVYLADWRFEDEGDLEGLIARLARRGQTFTVIGSEACFGRAWNDGIPRFSLGGDDYEPTIGRSPFGPRQEEAPWHGGDSAYPHVPYSFAGLPWKTEFAPDLGLDRDRLDAGDFEDLAERLGGDGGKESAFRLYPLASSFGPYPLMRAAAETGGHYFLYSFNPERRVGIVYDYGRCNRYEPDLRSRREVLGTARGSPLPAALLRTWRVLGRPSVRLVDLTPPLTPRGAPAEIERVASGDGLSFAWMEPADHERFLRDVEDRIRILDERIRDLRSALAAPTPDEAPWPRYRADAELLLFTLDVLRFELAEAREVADEVPAEAFEDEDSFPVLVSEDWLPDGRGRPRQVEAGEVIRQARERHLEKYGGTPFGETVARNPVVTWRLRRVPRPEADAGGDPGRTPSESMRDLIETLRGGGTPPGGSSGGGSSTGK